MCDLFKMTIMVIQRVAYPGWLADPIIDTRNYSIVIFQCYYFGSYYIYLYNIGESKQLDTYLSLRQGTGLIIILCEKDVENKRRENCCKNIIFSNIKNKIKM